MDRTELLHPEELHRLLTKVDKQQAHITELEKRNDNIHAELLIMQERFVAKCSEVEEIEGKLVVATECIAWYADPNHWTIEWVEESFGDYGSRARKARAELNSDEQSEEEESNE